MSKQKIKNKIYALIIVVTLFVSVNNLSQAEEKSTIAGTEELTNTNNVDNTTNDTANKDEVGDDKKTISNGYTEDEIEMINDATNKKNQKKSARQVRAKRRKNDAFEAERETREDLKVGSIEFSNLKELSPDLLLSKIPVKSGDDYSNKKLSDIYLSLRRLRYIAEANVRPEIQGDTVNIMVDVAEAENAAAILKQIETYEEMQKETNYTVASIDMEGTKTLNKEDYLKDLPIKVGDILIPQKVVDGAQKIYKSGYFSTVEPKVDRKSDNTVSIVYEVNENPVIQSINFEGNTLYKDAELEKALGIKKGKILNSNLLEPDENGVIKLYNKDGYYLPRIESINVSTEGDVNIGLTEGVVDSVEFVKVPSKKDNERQSLKSSTLRTKPYIFERVQKIKPGQILQVENIKQTVNELYRTGIFNSIAPEFEGKEDDPNARVVKFNVEERPTTTINGSISYGTSVGLVGGLKLSDDNFLGRDQQASINIEASNKGDKTFSIDWFDPWMKNTERVQLGGSAYWKESEDDDAEWDELEKVKTIGTRWTVGKGLNKDIYVRTSARFDHKKEIYSGGEVKEKYNLIALSPEFIYDTRDNINDPTKGLYADFSYEKGKLLSDPRKYDRFEADLRAFHPVIGKKNTMAYRAVWGSTGSGTPDSMRFSIGGAESVRGYEYGAFDGYDQFFASIENRTRINDTIQLVAFFDIGNAWQKEGRNARGRKIYSPDRKSAHDFKDLKKGYGIGLRLNTPIGPLRFDYGWPMDPETKDGKKGKGKFYFSFGQSF